MLDANLDEFYSIDNDEFLEKFEPIALIGEGGFGKVYKCKVTDEVGQPLVAVKLIQLGGNVERKKRECENMQRLQTHPNIVQYYASYCDDKMMAIVMEYCEGKDLFDVMEHDRNWLKFSEEEARTIFVQLARALAFLHFNREIHRDIKPENIFVLKQRDENGELVVKLLDFGLSKFIGDGEQGKTVAGTKIYMAPEINAIRCGHPVSYGESCDCWSVGILLYILLFATTPEFNTERTRVNLPPTNEVLVGANSVGAATTWNQHLSVAARDMLKGLLVTNPVGRYTMLDALMHPWVSR